MLKLDLWQAFERHLHSRVREVADAGSVAQLPPLNGTVKEQDTNVRLFMEILDNRDRVIVNPRRRTVHVSDVLTQSPKYPRFAPRISRIRTLLETGSPAINDPQQRFFSELVESVLLKKRKKKNDKPAKDKKALRVFLDSLLHIWGIHHMHLGEVERTNDLLFVAIRDDDAYFINIYDHGDFTSVGPLEVAQRNWPALFEHLPGISGMDRTHQQVALMRRRNGNYSPNVNGIALMPNEIITPDGRTVRMLREFDFISDMLRTHQEQLCTPGSDLRQRLAQALAVQEDLMDLEVVDDGRNFGDKILLKDAYSGKMVRWKFRELTRAG